MFAALAEFGSAVSTPTYCYLISIAATSALAGVAWLRYVSSR